MSDRLLPRLGWWGMGLGVLLGAAVVRLVGEGQSELAASDAAWAEGDATAAVVHARSAALTNVPWAPHVGAALDRLRIVAETSEARGDFEMALFAWRATRAACIGSRPLTMACDGARQAADQAIQGLATSARRTAGLASPGKARKSGEDAAALLAGEVPPRAAWGALLLMGAVLWAAAGVRFASKAHHHDGRLNRAELRWVAAMSGGGLIAWLVGLWMA